MEQQILNDIATTTGPIGTLLVLMWVHFTSVLRRIEKQNESQEKRIIVLEVKNGIAEPAAE